MNKSIATPHTSTKNMLSSLSSFYSNHKEGLEIAFIALLCIQFVTDFIDTTFLLHFFIKLGVIYDLFLAIVAFSFTLIALSNVLFTIMFDINVSKIDKYVSLLLLVVAIIFSLTSKDYDSSEITDFLFCTAACIGRSYKKTFRALLFSGITVFTITVLASQAGLISDLIYSPARHSLGIVYCTDCAAHVLYLLMAFLIYKKFKLSPDVLMILIFSFEICYFINMAKTVAICIIIALIGISIEKIWLNKYKKSFLSHFKKFMLVVFPLAYILFCLFTVMYSLFPNHFPDGTLTARFSITADAFAKFSISFSGKQIKQSGNGGTGGSAVDASSDTNILFNYEKNGFLHFTFSLFFLIFAISAVVAFTKKYHKLGYTFALIDIILLATPGIVNLLTSRNIINPENTGIEDYFWLDCSFIRIILCNGILIFISITCLSLYIQYKAYKSGNYLFMFIMCIIALDCTLEHHLSDLSYNFIFLIALTDYFKTHEVSAHSLKGY